MLKLQKPETNSTPVMAPGVYQRIETCRRLRTIKQKMKIRAHMSPARSWRPPEALVCVELVCLARHQVVQATPSMVEAVLPLELNHRSWSEIRNVGHA